MAWYPVIPVPAKVVPVEHHVHSDEVPIIYSELYNKIENDMCSLVVAVAVLEFWITVYKPIPNPAIAAIPTIIPRVIPITFVLEIFGILSTLFIWWSILIGDSIGFLTLFDCLDLGIIDDGVTDRAGVWELGFILKQREIWM